MSRKKKYFAFWKCSIVKTLFCHILGNVITIKLYRISGTCLYICYTTCKCFSSLWYERAQAMWEEHTEAVWHRPHGAEGTYKSQGLRQRWQAHHRRYAFLSNLDISVQSQHFCPISTFLSNLNNVVQSQHFCLISTFLSNLNISVQSWHFCPISTFLSNLNISVQSQHFCPISTFLSNLDISVQSQHFCPISTFLKYI